MPASSVCSTKGHPFQRDPSGTFFSMAVPVLFSLIAEPLTGLADTAFIARLGDIPLAALGVGTMALSAVLWACTCIGVGTQTKIAQAMGAQNIDRASRICGTALLLGFALGVVGMLAPLPVLNPLATAMGAHGEITLQAVEYIRLRLIGVPAFLVTVAAIGTLRGLQDMQTPLWVACIVNALNIVLDWVLIFGVGPFPALGISGAALATSCSQWIGAIWTLVALRKHLAPIWHVHLHELKALCSISGDLFVRSGMVILFLLLSTRMATIAGADSGAAHQAIRQFFIFATLLLDTFAITGQSLIALFFGQGNIQLARHVATLVCRWSLWVGIAMGIAMIVGQTPIIWLLLPESAVHVFIPAWIVAALIQPISALSFATDGVHWGTGDFRFIRNAMIVASTLAVAALWFTGYMQPQALLCWIWGAHGLWTATRAVFGLMRIWPGSRNAPLGVYHPNKTTERQK